MGLRTIFHQSHAHGWRMGRIGRPYARVHGDVGVPELFEKKKKNMLQGVLL